jgi:hypothetical protein
MPPETVFAASNALALPAWLLLAVAPRWRWTLRVAAVLPLLLACVYLAILIATLGRTEGGFGSLGAVAKLFQNPWALTAGWIHFLIFDLFVGAWEVRDSQRLGIPHGYVIPALALTFLFGPVGLLTWFAIRASLRRNAPW